MSGLAELQSLLREIDDVDAAASVLGWDQSTYMPPGGAQARGRQLSTLSRLAHGLRTASAFGDALERAEREVGGAPPDTVDAALVRVARRDRERAVRIPSELVSDLRGHLAASYVAWTRARADGDFATMRPFLERTVELSRRFSDCFTGWEHPADPHIDLNDPGMTVARVAGLFAELREGLVPLVRAYADRPQPDRALFRGDYPEAEQLAFSAQVIGRLGYDFERGRQDLTHHPFMTRFSTGDVRITTRVRRDDFAGGFFATVHECGHALYEQNIDPSLDGTPLGHGVSAGVHESQSRLWENLVARSRPFWEWLLPLAKERFPQQLGAADLDEVHRAVNRVERSLVRVEADEVTYNLHVLIRVDLAHALLDGSLRVAELPEAWAARYESDLGVRPPDHRRGVLQDVHWYAEPIGGQFQGYTLGNLLAAQLWAAARRDLPEMQGQIARGDFAPLREWLTDRVHRHGAVHEPEDLVRRATGAALGTSDFLTYLRDKHSALHGI